MRHAEKQPPARRTVPYAIYCFMQNIMHMNRQTVYVHQLELPWALSLFCFVFETSPCLSASWVVDQAFSEWWPECHCRSLTHFVSSESGRNTLSVLWDYPQSKESPGNVTISQSLVWIGFKEPERISPSAAGHLLTLKTLGSMSH